VGHRQDGGPKSRSDYTPVRSDVLERGTQLTIWRAAYDQGERWLDVKGGPYGPHLWIREADVWSIAPETLVGEENRTTYGADTRVRRTVDG
jgi:hypothetical protein